MLEELAGLIERHARSDLTTSIDGLTLAKVTTTEPDYSLTEPILVVMARGGKRILLGDDVYEYGAGDFLVVTTDLPVSGNFLHNPSLGVGLALRPAKIAPLVLEHPIRTAHTGPAIATGQADRDLLDAVLRMVRLLDQPRDARVLAPLTEQEILWRLLTGPQGALVRQIGLADSHFTHVNRAIQWIRTHFAEPLRVEELARLAAMSPSAFHRHFRATTRLSPLQFQKQLRLQEARALLLSHPGDVTSVAHLVGYESASQFSREYRRFFGSPPSLAQRTVGGAI